VAVRWGALAVVLAAGGAVVALSCSLPQIVVPPYDASMAEASADARAEGGEVEAGADVATGADASDATVTPDVPGTEDGPPVPDAPGLPEATTEAGAPDSSSEGSTPQEAGPPMPCDSGCVAYVLSDVPGDAGVVAVISTSPLALIDTIPVGNDPLRVAFTPDGGKAYVIESGDGTVTVIDTASRQVTKTVSVTMPNGASLRSIAVTTDGRFAFVGDGADDEIVVIDTSTDTLTGATTAVTVPGPYGVAFTPDGGEVWAGGAGSNAVQRLDAVSRLPLGTITGAGGHLLGDRIVFTPDLSAAFASTSSACQCCGETDKLDPHADAATYANTWAASAYGLAMGPGGTFVYGTTQATPLPCSAAQINGQVWMVNAASQFFDQVNGSLTYDEPRGLAVAADGTLVIVAGYQGAGASPGLIVYDAATLTQLETLALPGQPQDVVVVP
jgi:YVTN family beta-propeller protein